MSSPEESAARLDAIERVPARSFEEASAKDVLVSTALWTAGLGWLIPSMGAMTLIYSVVPSHRLDVLGRIYSKVQVALTGNRWRAVVHPDVDPNQPYVFVQNHTNHYDHVVLYNATPHFKQGLELESHFRYPFYGWFMRKRGTIPVRPGSQGQTPAIMARMHREIAEGRSILAFPEGTRTTDGRVQSFRKGVFYIARDLGVPIVPVSVTGTFDMMRKGSPVIRPGNEITVYCDQPIPTRGLSDEEIPALAERAREVVASRVDAYWAARLPHREAEQREPRDDAERERAPDAVARRTEGARGA